MQTTKRNTKKVVAIVLSLVLVAALAIGGTLAWLTVVTNQEVNTFNVLTAGGASPSMKATLTETAWTAGEQAKAIKMMPGGTVAKNPIITNESTEDIDEWVAIQLTFTKGDGTTELTATEVTTLFKVIEFTTTANWVKKSGGTDIAQGEIYYYNTILEPTDATANLFPNVKVKDGAVNADLETIKTWAGFKIVVDGAAVQGDIATTLTADVKTALDALFA